MTQPIDRILDANLNRAREGLRVGEEIARLVLEDATLQAAFKAVRHGITAAEKRLGGAALLQSRSADRDPGSRPQPRLENRRTDWPDLAQANLRRAEEALRVLEEVAKLRSTEASAKFKATRFKAYVLEQRLAVGLLAGGKRWKRANR